MTQESESRLSAQSLEDPRTLEAENVNTATTSGSRRHDPGNILPSGQQVVLILVGLIGSGKSTFAEALERHFPQFRRCSQDDLGDRRSVEALARVSLRDGLSVCIDRTNFDESQRAHWINIAYERPRTQVWVIVFDTPYEICAARVAARTDHPTITNSEQGLQILQRFRSQYCEPLPHEGYTRILRLTPSDFPDVVVSEDVVRDVMRRLQDSPEVTSTLPSGGYRGLRGASPQRGWQPRGGYGFRGGYVRGGYGGAGLSQSTLPWGRGDGGGSQWQPYPTGRAYNSDNRGRWQSQSGNDRTETNWRRAGPS